jgi:hypothetical protein
MSHRYVRLTPAYWMGPHQVYREEAFWDMKAFAGHGPWVTARNPDVRSTDDGHIWVRVRKYRWWRDCGKI